LAFAVIPSPPTTLIVLVEAIVPPPVKPSPAVIETPLWSMCSFATKPLKLSCTISESLVVISFEFAVIPVPPTTFIVLFAAIVPPPVKPAPAVIETDEWSMCSFATNPLKSS